MAFNLTLRKVYLYVFAATGLILLIVGSVNLVNLGLKTYIFKNADNTTYYVPSAVKSPDGTSSQTTQEEQANVEKQQTLERQSNRERQAASGLASIIVGLPLFIYHWRRISKENQV